MTWNSIGIDKDTTAMMGEPQRLNFVENLLRCDYSQSAFRKSLHYVLDQLQKESHDARPYMDKKLQQTLASIIERIKTLYGQAHFISKVTGNTRVERWIGLCEWTLSKIEETQTIVEEILKRE
jgi:hypothetical protein